MISAHCGAFVLGATISARHALSRPDTAVLLMVAGCLLIYVECNRPGRVVPGATGLLLLLLGAFRLGQSPLCPTSVWLLLAAVAMIAIETRVATRGLLAVAGCASLVYGLATVVDSPLPTGSIHVWVAVSAGIGFGGISFALASIAMRARRNKRLFQAKPATYSVQ